MALLDSIKDIQNGRIITNDAEPNEHWVTIKGAHVLVNGEGKIVGGPKKFHGKYVKSQMPQKQEAKKPTSVSKTGLLSNIKGIEASLDNFDFDKFNSSKDPEKHIKKNVESLFSELGLGSKIKIVPDAEFNEAFKKAKISEFGRLMGGVSSVKAGYRSDTNTVWMRKSKLEESLKSKNEYRLFLNALFHEIGHAYHSDALGIKQQDKGEYGSGWCEEFADTFSGVMAGKIQNDRIKRNPESFPPKFVESAKKYNIEQSIKNNLIPLIKERK